MESARGRRYTGTWAVFGRGVLDRRSNFGAENRNVERIVSIDATSYVSESGGRRCVWTRVDLEQQKAERLAEEKARADQVKRNESLLKAASDGDARLTQELVAEGADMAVRNSRGNTALMVAASYGHTEVIKVLLAAGADPNVRSHFGSTALSLAKAKRQVEAARILMDAGAKQ
jgi:ankyrin repeat protein